MEHAVVEREEKNPTLKVHLKIKPYVHYCRYTGLLDIFDLSSYNLRLEFHLFLQQVIEGLDLLGSARHGLPPLAASRSPPPTVQGTYCRTSERDK